MSGEESDPLILNHDEIRALDFLDEGGGFSTVRFVEEVKRQLGLALPLIAVNMLQYCLQVISVMFVGHLGELPLASASMATSFASVTGFSVLVSIPLLYSHTIHTRKPIKKKIENFTIF